MARASGKSTVGSTPAACGSVLRGDVKISLFSDPQGVDGVPQFQTP